MKKRKAGKTAGLSLLEVLIAVGVLSVGILAIISLYPMVFRNIENAWTHQTVSILARETMDYYIARGTFLPKREAVNEPIRKDIHDAHGNVVRTYFIWAWGDTPEFVNNDQLEHLLADNSKNKTSNAHEFQTEKLCSSNALRLQSAGEGEFNSGGSSSSSSRTKTPATRAPSPFVTPAPTPIPSRGFNPKYYLDSPDRYVGSGGNAQGNYQKIYVRVEWKDARTNALRSYEMVGSIAP